MVVLTVVGKLSMVLSRIWPALYERAMARSLRHALE
jgi:hypothetical protein